MYDCVCVPLVPPPSPPVQWTDYPYEGAFSLQEHLPSYPGPDGYPVNSDEPFSAFEIRLMRQVSGFGFRIIGGKEEGSQVSVCDIVTVPCMYVRWLAK